MPKEKYQASRNNGNEASDSSKKAAKTAAKAIGNKVAPGIGGQVVDKLANTKLGNKALNKMGKQIDKNPALKKAAKKLDDNGGLDKANQGMNIMNKNASFANKKSNNQSDSDEGKKETSEGSELSNKISNKINPLSRFAKRKSKFSNGSLDSDLETDLDLDTDSTTAVIEGLKNVKKYLPAFAPLGFIFLICICILVVISASKKDGSGELASGSNIGEDSSSIVAGECSYAIKGFSNGERTIKKEINLSNIKVRLMECNSNDPVPGEELVDFEKYILGVVYQESGGNVDEAIKVQAVATRSYTLSRPTMMGNAGPLDLKEENGNWVIQIRSCTKDQAYCDPDRGCSSDIRGGEGATIHSGVDKNRAWTRGPMASDDRLRNLVAQTQGEVLLNSNGYLLNSGYKNPDQVMWDNKAKQGFDYKQILLEHYNTHQKIGATEIARAACTESSSTSIFANWKQYDSAWGSVPLGSSKETIKSAGCLVTSVSMLIAKSGVSTNISDFNPGNFVKTLNGIGGFTGPNYNWNKATEIAPGFVYQSKEYVLGKTRAEKYAILKNLLDQGYYVTAEVKGNTGQHWVAIDKVSGSDNFVMMDPGSEGTILWNQYDSNNTSTFSYYKIS